MKHIAAVSAERPAIAMIEPVSQMITLKQSLLGIPGIFLSQTQQGIGAFSGILNFYNTATMVLTNLSNTFGFTLVQK